MSGLWNLAITKWMQPKLRRYAVYVFFGGMTSLVNFGTYTALTRLTGWPVTPANATAVFISVLFAYVTNKHFVFRSKTDGLRSLAAEFAKFVGGRALTMALEVGGLHILSERLGWYDLLAKAIVAVAVIILNYVFSVFLVFRSRIGNVAGNDPD